MLTREEALDLISDVEKFYCESADEYGYYCYEAESVIDKIYDSFEEAMKLKTCDGCEYLHGVICKHDRGLYCLRQFEADYFDPKDKA